MKKPPKVFIVIAVYNRAQRTLQLIRSIYKQTYRNIEIILVDDGSTDNTFSIVRNNYPRVTIIQGTGEWWWAGSLNRGIDHAMQLCDKVNDFLLHVNNDVLLDDINFIKKIVSIQRRIPDSIVVPKTILHETNEEFPAGVYFFWENAKKFMVPELDIRSDQKYQELDALFTKTILIPFSVFMSIGLLDEKRYPQYQGDVDFTYRARKKGYKLIKANDISICNYNYESDSGVHFKDELSLLDIVKILFSTRSSSNIIKNIQFIMQHCPRKFRWRNSFYFALRTSIAYGKKHWLCQKLIGCRH